MGAVVTNTVTVGGKAQVFSASAAGTLDYEGSTKARETALDSLLLRYSPLPSGGNGIQWTQFI